MSKHAAIEALRRLLKNQPCTIDQMRNHLLQQQYDASVSTLRRYISHLREVYADQWQEIESAVGRKKSYHIASTANDIKYVLAPFVVQRAIRQLRGINDIASVAQAIKMLARAHPVTSASIMLTEQEMPFIDIGDYQSSGVDIGVLEQLVFDIQNNNLVTITYRGKVSSPKQPLRIVEYRGLLYVIFWSAKFNRYEPYRLDGISNVSASHQSAQTKTFDFDAFMSTRFGLWEGDPPVSTHVVVEIHDIPTAANFKERTWHPSQIIHDLPNGGIRIDMHCGLSPELTSWILHWAPKIKVVEPMELKERVKELARAVMTD
jgi:predicted DNA-binding transcriptional regulator YafY